MKLHVLFGQKNENYTGQYGVEALAVMSEYDQEENPDYLPDEKRKHDQSGEFERTEIVTLKTDEKSVMSILRPHLIEIPAPVA